METRCTAVVPVERTQPVVILRYDQAKAELAQCARVDELKDWADKSAALIVYARQAGDMSLMKNARRIQVRAIRRIGQLLSEFDGRGRPPKNTGDDPIILPPSRQQAGTSVGLSPDQVQTASRVAEIPDAEFERLVEGFNPPTVTALVTGEHEQDRPRVGDELMRSLGRVLKAIQRAYGSVDQLRPMAPLIMGKGQEVCDALKALGGALEV